MINIIIGLVVSFALGLTSTFIVDGIRKHLKRKKDKEFVINYLKESTLKILPNLKNAYSFVIQNIEALGLKQCTIEAFEDFNSNVLKGITYTDYYQIFKRKEKRDFILLVEIIAVIDFLCNQLPSKINNDYFANVKNHLIETGNRGDKEHVLSCEYCKYEKLARVEFLKKKIEEVNLLELKINELISVKRKRT
jgi:hypothetical protein